MTTQLFFSLAALAVSLLFAPLLPGIINRVKAKMGGRQGRPLLQLYYDLNRLVRKSPVYPQISSWVFMAGPVVVLATTSAALFLIPSGGIEAVVNFSGDCILLAGLLALGRFAMILAALDTGSAFEGMGAAREALFSALAEPIFLLALVLLGYNAGDWSLSAMLNGVVSSVWAARWPFFLLIALALFLIMLVENSRIPVDDPNTHLELTMIHEVMILDHSGPDLAMLEYAASLKLWLFLLLISGVIMPVFGDPLFTVAGKLGPEGLFGICVNLGATLLCVLGLAILVGLVESLMARLRMGRIPQILTLAGAFVCLAGLIVWRHG